VHLVHRVAEPGWGGHPGSTGLRVVGAGWGGHSSPTVPQISHPDGWSLAGGSLGCTAPAPGSCARTRDTAYRYRGLFGAGPAAGCRRRRIFRAVAFRGAVRGGDLTLRERRAPRRGGRRGGRTSR